MMELVDREIPLQELEAAWRQAAEKGCFTFIYGEAGIGKTALVEQFANREKVHTRFLWGACDALFTPRPLGPLHDIATQTQGELFRLLQAEAQRPLVFSACLQELQRAPAVVVFEDIHWADEATLDLLKYLGRRIHLTRTLLVVTYRDDELGGQHPLRLLLGDLATSPALRRLNLAPLSIEGVQRLIGERPLDPRSLYRQTGGGGDLRFGPDGYLYVATGDGGSGGDPWGQFGNGQNPQTLLGKILRLDVTNGSPYAIPGDNPFVGDAGALDEIWALGLRNPWRISFDRETGDLFIADVGQNAREEVNFQPAASSGGENYGWRCYEGNAAFNLSGCGSAGSYVFPIYDYPHTNNQNPDDAGQSITGGFVYRGQQFPALTGHYLFADFVRSHVWLARSEGGDWLVEPLGRVAGLSNPSTFGEGCDGELYVAGYGGTLYQVQGAAPQLPVTSGEFLLFLPLIAGGTGDSLACD
jgi:hypothetical protein